MILRLLLVEFVMKDAWIALEDMKIPSESLGVFRSLSYNFRTRSLNVIFSVVAKNLNASVFMSFDFS